MDNVGECSNVKLEAAGTGETSPNPDEPADLEIDLDDVEKEDTMLGRGSFSVVHPAMYKNERVAVKTINTGSLTITQQEAFRSVSIMA